VAGQTGNFQLNVTLPLIAVNLLDGIGLLANVSRLLADKRDRRAEGARGPSPKRWRATRSWSPR
jgi:fumarate hydratase class II